MGGFGFEGQTPPPRCGNNGVDIEARDSAFERTPIVFFKGVARTKVRCAFIGACSHVCVCVL